MSKILLRCKMLWLDVSAYQTALPSMNRRIQCAVVLFNLIFAILLEYRPTNRNAIDVP